MPQNVLTHFQREHPAAEEVPTATSFPEKFIQYFYRFKGVRSPIQVSRKERPQVSDEYALLVQQLEDAGKARHQRFGPRSNPDLDFWCSITHWNELLAAVKNIPALVKLVAPLRPNYLQDDWLRELPGMIFKYYRQINYRTIKKVSCLTRQFIRTYKSSE